MKTKSFHKLYLHVGAWWDILAVEQMRVVLNITAQMVFSSAILVSPKGYPYWLQQPSGIIHLQAPQDGANPGQASCLCYKYKNMGLGFYSNMGAPEDLFIILKQYVESKWYMFCIFYKKCKCPVIVHWNHVVQVTFFQKSPPALTFLWGCSITGACCVINYKLTPATPCCIWESVM